MCGMIVVVEKTGYGVEIGLRMLLSGGGAIAEIRGFAAQTAGFLHKPAQPASERQFPRE